MKKALIFGLLVGLSIGELQGQVPCPQNSVPLKGNGYDLSLTYKTLENKHTGDNIPVQGKIKIFLHTGDDFKNCITKQDLNKLKVLLNTKIFKSDTSSALIKFKQDIDLVLSSKTPLSPTADITALKSETVITVSTDKIKYRTTLIPTTRDSSGIPISYITGKIEIDKGSGNWITVRSANNINPMLPESWSRKVIGWLINFIIIIIIIIIMGTVGWLIWPNKIFLKQRIYKLMERSQNGNSRHSSDVTKEGKPDFMGDNESQKQDDKKNKQLKEELQDKHTLVGKLNRKIEDLEGEIQRLKNNANKNSQGKLQQANSAIEERDTVAFVNKENDYLKKEINKLKDKIQGLEKNNDDLVEELKKLDKSEPEQSPNKSDTEPQITALVTNHNTTKTFFLSTPTATPDGYCTFLDQRKPQFDPTSSLYRFQLINSDEKEAQFWFESTSGTVSWALKNPETHLKPACEYSGLNSAATEIKTAQPGKAVKLENGVWRVTQKASIKFI